MADVYNYLSISNEFVTVAILLGMAATAAQCRRERNQQHEEATTDQRENEADVSRELSFTQAADDELEEDQTPNLESFAAGSTQKLLSGVEMELTLERSVSKMLCLHIPSLLPPPFAEFSVPASTQTAALLGLGILYQGTGHRLMTELLLTEIIRSPSSSQFLGSSTNSGMSTTSFDQLKGYALAAGLALGLVTLGRGNSTSGDPGLADLKLEEKLYKYVVGGAHQFGDPGAAGSCMYRGRKWKSFGSSSGNGRSPPMSTAIGVGRATKLQTERHVRGEHVNIGVTGCGSALALGFMYMMTNNKSIASQLAIPDTLTLLDYVRPDILLIRTLAKNLVMWDEIEPTQSWIYETEMPKQLKEAFETLSSDSDLNTSSLPPTADIGSICEAHANIAAAAAFSIGLRFAGTANSKAREALRKMFMHFRDLRSKMALVTRDLVADNTERVTVERSLTLCAQAMALVDGGTGNVETLKLLRSINLRQRVDSELTYGNHMGQSMAIGLLFIGGGRATILRTREAIAALVISLYPMTPMNTADNKYHLQAFRHLYVLAVDTSRLVETVDVDTGSSCSAELRVEVANSVDDSPEWRTFKTPCLLPDLETVKAIVIESGSYYPVRIIVSAGNNMSDESDELHSPANVARLQLLRQKNMVLLKAHQQTEPLPVFATTPAIDRAVVMTLDGLARPDERLMAGFQQYFVRPATSSGTNAPISAWWREQCKEWVLRRSTKTCNFTLPWNMNLLQAVFRLHHLPLDSAWELRNVKLLQMHWGSCESSLVELNMQERDDRFWIKTEADEALRALIDTSVIPRVVNDPSRESVASIVRILNRQGQLSRQDVFLVTALLDYFDGRDLFQLQTPGGNVPSRFSLQEFLASSTRSPYDKQVWLAIASFILFSV
ncbi:TPA: hypothetical protein N0F65_003893 [Lagenidium giganteum]|uniref:Anaphase-promoting complex subunit 1 beta-sandwich domain-containing protein n=1 Tax=Lagenidium giganteum TaxID=4803 RepID=A0AAV2Z870_9STRA|nr:TPA: hypothetical protein N0F65_003893 [Lagenidium giganteum]